MRADMEDISIGEGSNVQDTAVVHADPGHPARVGSRVSVGHGAVLHGCTVSDGALIGMNATVLNGAIIGAGSLVAANALVLEGTEVPPGSLVAGVPAKVRRPLTPEEIEHCSQNAATYPTLTLKHRGAAPLALRQLVPCPNTEHKRSHDQHQHRTRPSRAAAAALPDEGHVSAVVADVVAERAGHLFGLMGNGNAHLISRLTRRGFPFTSARHDAATVAMADAYHRATGDVAAATTTYGAGFTNAYTTLAEARMARIPLVLVVGDAPSSGPPAVRHRPGQSRPKRPGSSPWSPARATPPPLPTAHSTSPCRPSSPWCSPFPTTSPPPRPRHRNPWNPCL